MARATRWSSSLAVFFEAVAHGHSLPWTNGGRDCDGSGASFPPLSLRDVNLAPLVVAARQGGGVAAGSVTTRE